MDSLRVPSFVRDQIRCRIEKRFEALEKGYRQNIGLIGLPGLGKSYILTALFKSLCAQQQFIPVYVHAETLDFDHLIERWIGSMLSGVFLSQGIKPPPSYQSLVLAAEPVIPKTTEKIRQLKKMLRREKETACLRELFSLTGVLADETGKKVILMIDEFQALENYHAADPFSVLGKEIMVEKNTLYLVSSSTPSRAHDIFREKLTLLFGNFEVIDLAPFGFSETQFFLNSRLPCYEFSEAQRRFLIRMTDGKPAYLELLCDRIEGILGHDAPTPFPGSDFKAPVADDLLLEAFYRELFSEKGRISLFFDRRIEVCRRLAKDSSPYIRVLLAISSGRRKVLGISTFIERKVVETKKILQRLVLEDLISKAGSFYVINDPLFRFWLKEVLQKKNQLYTPDHTQACEELKKALLKEFEHSEYEERADITSRVEKLFKEFRNDVLEIDERKLQCPQFSEIAFRPANGRVFPLLARNSKVRWLCQIANQKVREEDVLGFLDELKRYRKDVQRRIMITLAGIEQNAKLLAQEAQIQLWDLRCFNTLLDLYDQPKVILFSEKEGNETDLGALAQSLHTA